MHIHDVTGNFEYPSQWFEEGRAWNELYILRAFLMYNQTFRVVLFRVDVQRAPRFPQGADADVRCRRRGPALAAQGSSGLAQSGTLPLQDAVAEASSDISSERAEFKPELRLKESPDRSIRHPLSRRVRAGVFLNLRPTAIQAP